MKCLIIAAGQGTRLKSKGEIEPLVTLLGLPLIERVIRSAIEGGADEFVVITGYEGDRSSDFYSHWLNVLVLRQRLFRLLFDDQGRARMIEDPMGDQLDAALRSVQAARAWMKRDQDYGVAAVADRLEGWIVAPALLAAGIRSRPHRL